MIPMRLLTLNSYHFLNPRSGKGEGGWVVLASDPFDADHNPGVFVACGTMVHGQNWHFWSTLSGENPLNGGI